MIIARQILWNPNFGFRSTRIHLTCHRFPLRLIHIYHPSCVNSLNSHHENFMTKSVKSLHSNQTERSDTERDDFAVWSSHRWCSVHCVRVCLVFTTSTCFVICEQFNRNSLLKKLYFIKNSFLWNGISCSIFTPVRTHSTSRGTKFNAIAFRASASLPFNGCTASLDCVL